MAVIIYKSDSAKTVGLRSRGETYGKNQAGKIVATFTTPPVKAVFFGTDDGMGTFKLTSIWCKSNKVSEEEAIELIEALPGFGSTITRVADKDLSKVSLKSKKANLVSGHKSLGGAFSSGKGKK